MTLSKIDQKIYWLYKDPRKTRPKISSAQNSEKAVETTPITRNQKKKKKLIKTTHKNVYTNSS